MGFWQGFCFGNAVLTWISSVELWITCKRLRYWKRLWVNDLWISGVEMLENSRDLLWDWNVDKLGDK